MEINDLREFNRLLSKGRPSLKCLILTIIISKNRRVSATHV